jgi:adenine-specific DNA-methyltransferase
MGGKINKTSKNILDENISKLEKIFPNVFSEGKIDYQKLKENLGEFINSDDEKYSFSWAGRSDSIKNIQIPSIGTLISDKDESINFDDTKNIFIEGENLEVLKLLQKSYYGKVKMIYIDPPYNTGNDFIYKDNFKQNLSSYLEQTGQSESGISLTTNPETSGRYHSDWISFMYPRLFFANTLLKDNGVLFVSIDANEDYNLRQILNEIFGEENFLGEIIRKTKSTTNDAKNGFNIHHEQCLVYAKNKSNLVLKGEEKSFDSYSNTDNDPRGSWTSSDPTATDDGRLTKNLMEIKNPITGKIDIPGKGRRWLFNKNGFKKLVSEKRIVFKKNHGTSERGFILKRYQNELQSMNKLVPSLMIGNEFMNQSGTKELLNIFDEKLFDHPKPSSFIEKLIQYSDCDSDDIVLDFFTGSGTTANAVLKFNVEHKDKIKFLCIQIPEFFEHDSSTHYKHLKTISDIAKERIRYTINKLNEDSEHQKLKSTTMPIMGFKVFKLSKSNYKIWEDVKDETKLKEQLKLFEDPLIENYKDIDVIYEIIIKEGYSLNSKIEEFQKKPNKIYKVSDDEFFFYVTLDKQVNLESIEKLKLDKNIMFVCLDSAIDDSQKTNLDKLCKLRTI